MHDDKKRYCYLINQKTMPRTIIGIHGQFKNDRPCCRKVYSFPTSLINQSEVSLHYSEFVIMAEVMIDGKSIVYFPTALYSSLSRIKLAAH